MRALARIRRTAGLTMCQTALFVLGVLAICTAVPLHIALLQRFDAAQRSGFSPEAVRSIARAMVDVMCGADREILREWFTADEVLHMKDVQWLFGVGKRLFWVLAALGGACLLPGRKTFAGRERALCARAALALSLILPALIAVPFAVDFNGMFIWLHRLAFPDNELWLMNPAVHKMVVVYNEEFFTAAVALIGTACAASLVPLIVMCRRGREKK